MASTLAPFGLRPADRISGAATTQGFTKYPILSGYAVAIMNGDPVILLHTGAGRGRVNRINGTVTATTITSTAGTTGTLGVLVGCEYTDPTSNQFLPRHNYPGSITASDIKAYVVDDPEAVFLIQADDTLTNTAIGCNAALIQTVVGNTTTKNSGLALDASSVADTATLPLRIVGFLEDARNSVGDAYPVVKVRLNIHHHRQTTGTSAS